MRKAKFAILFIVLLCGNIGSVEFRSTFNNHVLDLNERANEFSFWVGGHLFGAHGESVYPSPSLLANLDNINSRDAKFFVSLGDIVRRPESLDMDFFRQTFTSKLIMPFFNTAGNRDISTTGLYEKRFGKTYFQFFYNGSLFIFLNSEENSRNIEGEQLSFLLTALGNAQERIDITQVFIFSHSLVWLAANPEFRQLFETAQLYYKDSNFSSYRSDIEPVLLELASRKPVYWFAGDIGMSWSFPIFFQKDSRMNLTYIATGLGNTEKDVLLYVTVTESGGIDFDLFSLTNQSWQSIDSYGYDFWINYFKHENNLIKRYWGKVNRMLRHIYFWMGIFVCLSLITVLGIIIYRMKYNEI